MPTGPHVLIALSISYWSAMYGVNLQLAYNICYLESSYNPQAVGDNGKAVGLWQWHKPSIDYVNRKMVEAGEIEKMPEEDTRKDIWFSTQAAMYTMGKLGLYRWWSTYERAKRLTSHYTE